MANDEGSVMLGQRIKLSKVLYVRLLQCNLISMVKLCKELNCSVNFFDDFCVLQNCILRTSIGVGEQRGGFFTTSRIGHWTSHKSMLSTLIIYGIDD